jgi:uncharacterized protein with PQ loop repeat
MTRLQLGRSPTSSVLAIIAVELFFLFLPLAIMWWYWEDHLNHTATHSPSFLESAELSMTSAVLYGLTMLKVFESTGRRSKKPLLVALYLYLLGMFVVSIISIGEVSRETTTRTAILQVANLTLGAITFFILGGRAEGNARGKHDTSE